MPRNGRTARYKVTTGSEKREIEMNRLIHMGGVESPISRPAMTLSICLKNFTISRKWLPV